MTVEKTVNHPYIVTLPQEIIGQLAQNRDLNGIDRFFYGLVHDLPLAEENITYQNVLNNPDITGAVNGYLEHAVESGKVEKGIRYVLSKYPNFDFHDLEEIVHFSVWRSFFAYPWENGYNEQELNTYLYTSMRWLTREVRYREHATYESIEIPRPSRAELLSDAFMSSNPHRPEDVAVQQASIDELASTLVERTTIQGIPLKKLKTEMLQLLSEGIEPKDIADLLGVQYARLKGWLRACQGVDIIDRSDRVEVDAGRNWHWSQHTAQVILNNPYAVKLLTERELKLLGHLCEGKSYSDVIRLDPSLFGAERGVKYKLKTHGAMDESVSETYRPRRRQLILFLNTIEPVNEEEQSIVQAIRETEGNIYQAARILQMTRGQILYFLVQRGYYDK